MGDLEVVFSLWYVTDRTGAIYSLRAQAYVADGSDEEKRAFLRSRAPLDYLVASPFPVPDGYHVSRAEAAANGRAPRLPVAHYGALEPLGGPVVLFLSVFTALERRFPSQTALTVGPRPLYCLTPLYADDDLVLHPVTTLRGSGAVGVPTRPESGRLAR